jgi:hypothetical protein
MATANSSLFLYSLALAFCQTKLPHNAIKREFLFFYEDEE